MNYNTFKQQNNKLLPKTQDHLIWAFPDHFCNHQTILPRTHCHPRNTFVPSRFSCLGTILLHNIFSRCSKMYRDPKNYVKLHHYQRFSGQFGKFPEINKPSNCNNLKSIAMWKFVHFRFQWGRCLLPMIFMNDS